MKFLEFSEIGPVTIRFLISSQLRFNGVLSLAVLL
jgi:hypothetical protein